MGDDPGAAKTDGKFTDSIASLSDSSEGALSHAINSRPSFLPRGAGSEASKLYARDQNIDLHNSFQLSILASYRQYLHKPGCLAL